MQRKGYDVTNKTLAQFMSEVREYLPKLDGEKDEVYCQRLHNIAHPLFIKYMDSVQARWHAEQAKRARRDEILDARARAALRPVQNLNVHDERMSTTQEKLNRSRERYSRS